MDMKKWRKTALLLCLAFLLTGCRVRTGPGGAAGRIGNGGTGTGALENREGETGENSALPEAGEEKAPAPEEDESASRTEENPEARRKEYDENAAAEIVPGTGHLLHRTGEGEGTPGKNPEAGGGADRTAEEAPKPAVTTVPAGEADRMGTAEEAEEADSALTYFTVLLKERTGSLFECKKVNLYWETAREGETIHRASPEHALILEAGAYDVSSRLLPENLRVDGGWVGRKNPQVIVKAAEPPILGEGVHSAAAAAGTAERLLNREGLRETDAARTGKVLLISAELLSAPHLRTAAALGIAKTAYPELFEDVNPETALAMLAEEAEGRIPSGIHFYTVGEE